MLLERIAATTHVDKHGDQLTREALEDMAKSFNGNRCVGIGLEHDVTIPPLGKIVFAEVRPREDGHYELFVRQEIYEKDENVVLPNGTEAICNSSSIDSRPLQTHHQEVDKTQISVDRMDFDSESSYVEFIRSVQAEIGTSDYVFHRKLRKSLELDPQLTIDIVKTLVGAYFVKSVLDSAGKEIGVKLSNELITFYDHVRALTLEYTKRILPSNRPVTYVLNVPGTPHIQFVSVTSNPNDFLQAIQIHRLQDAIQTAYEYANSLSADRIQFILRNNNWEFNFMTTTSGEVIGTPTAIKKRAKVLELMIESTKKLRNKGR